MSTPATDTFQFGDHKVTVISDAYSDLVFYDPYGWCQFLLDHNGWAYIDEACRYFHYDHVAMFASWAVAEMEKLPSDVRNPPDGTVRCIPTLIRYLGAALPWKVANRNLDETLNDHQSDALTIAGEEAVRAAAKALINAALDYPHPYRDVMVRRSLVWADFVDRAWLQGLNIPTPWGTPRSQPR